jgi:serine protease AprX
VELKPVIICPLCQDRIDKLVYRYHLFDERNVIEEIKAQNPDWSEHDGACSRCVDYYHTEVILGKRELPGIGPHFPIRSADDFLILPTGLRLDVDPRFTGKSITICFIDSGFYAHPDLVNSEPRIRVMKDFTPDPNEIGDKGSANNFQWHGTMTSVVCAGDGYLSNGLYKGIASDAELVLLKVQDHEGRILKSYLISALEWILTHHTEFDIRIVNMSVGGDEPGSYLGSEVSLLAEQLVKAGVTVVAAVGNDANGKIKPPANAPGVIAIGGLDDENSLEKPVSKIYHSTFGNTVDDLIKPELIAPAIWVAAPILPETPAYREACTLYKLLDLEGEDFRLYLEKNIKVTQLHISLLNQDLDTVKKAIIQHLQSCKYISPYYMHVDGTSFAAPIVTGVIAQLLEADPLLTPMQLREILFSTAKRIDGIDPIKQGYGQVKPRKAILKALKNKDRSAFTSSPVVNREKQTITFYLKHECASQVSLSGSFNGWSKDQLLMEPDQYGDWKIEISMLPPGRHHYKFLVDEIQWMDDVNNPYRVPDGYNGFNSILNI